MFGKKKTVNFSEKLNEVYLKLLSKYPECEISPERKNLLSELLDQNGYVTYPYFKALNELTPNEVLYCLKAKWIANDVFDGEKFVFDKISPLARKNIKSSEWIQQEGHNIKLINLAGLGHREAEAGKFMDWLTQLVILPTGIDDILDTTIYLIPFHPREFGCAYLPRSSEVSQNLLDKDIEDLTGLDAKGQVKLFIEMAQLAGHPVIYDILPQTGRFSKAVLANPYIARWYDITALQNDLAKYVDEIAKGLSNEYDDEDLDVVKDIYKRGGASGDLSEYYQSIYDKFEELMNEHKKNASNNMLLKAQQEKIHRRVKEIVAKIENCKSSKKLSENDITKQLEIIQKLIDVGLWPAPGGAWCSSGVPIFDKMSDCGGYPTFKHFDYKGEDVTDFANLDCQTPYYFAYLESGKPNKPVIEFFINSMKELQREYNFDGFRVDHVDHVVDSVSEKDGLPISYRAPRTVLGKLNKDLKSEIPYFATLAEYMLWDNFYKEYHLDMGFDLLWGNDIVSQRDKNPQVIVDDNQFLTNYNVKLKKQLSLLKTYNNQDGEFNCIDQYPGQLGEKGAIFKWLKYKMLPGGKYAKRPVLYVDGDESYTKRGIEHAIGEEISMPRGENIDFYKEFNAIDMFVKQNPVITGGEAQIIIQEDDGFVAWMITKEPLKQAFLVIANYKFPTEKTNVTDENGNTYQDWVEGTSVYDKTLNLPSDFSISGEYILNDGEFELSENLDIANNEIKIDELKPAEYKIFLLSK